MPSWKASPWRRRSTRDTPPSPSTATPTWAHSPGALPAVPQSATWRCRFWGGPMRSSRKTTDISSAEDTPAPAACQPTGREGCQAQPDRVHPGHLTEPGESVASPRLQLAHGVLAPHGRGVVEPVRRHPPESIGPQPPLDLRDRVGYLPPAARDRGSDVFHPRPAV